MSSILTLPNQLTLLRILLVPFFVIFAIYHTWSFAFITFLVASVTDALDGYIARRFNQKSSLGAILDPLADKVLMASAYILLADKRLIPAWLSVVVISRDVLIVGGVIVLKLFLGVEVRIAPNMWGKATTFFQILTVIVVLFSKLGSVKRELLWLLYVITFVFTVISGYTYFRTGWEVVSASQNSQGSSR